MSTDKPEGFTDEQWEKYLEHEMSWARMLKERFEKELKSKPPLPPWLEYPDISEGDIFWRMGTGEDYLVEYFGLYFKYATSAEVDAYVSKYPEPKEWLGTYEAFKH